MSVKAPITVLLAVAVGFVAAGLIVAKREAGRYAVLLAQRQAVWQAEKADLEAALAAAQARNLVTPVVRPPVSRSFILSRPSPREIIEKLQALRPTPGEGSPRLFRQAVYLLEELAQAGPAAFPAIREFLARYEDLDLDTSPLEGRGARDRVPLDFAIPPSLRFGLFDVLRRSGSADAAEVLAESLARTGRGIEVAYLSRVLQELAPDRYRDLALSTAHALLAGPAPAGGSAPLDRNHRDHLFGVLAFYGDNSYASEAQAQLVRADSQLDRGALRYLQRSLGVQAVPIVAEAYNHPVLTNSAAREPLARLALSFVGADTQANEFYARTINDPVLTRSDRQNLIEDLNEDGFADPKNLTLQDLPLIQNRIAFIEELAPGAMDDANAAAFKEAYKDLLNMRGRLLTPPDPAPPPAVPGQPQP
jgi:hypothetical protein